MSGPYGRRDRCPLCSAAEGRVRERVRFDAIWQALNDEYELELPEVVRERHAPVEEVELRDCSSCGLGWFSPLIAGDAEFYSRLMGVVPYESSRWDFEAVAARLAPGDAVADFGSGAGAFLRSLEGRVRLRVGVDHNARAAAALRDGGAEGFAGSFADFAAANEGRFDVACAFQVLEHLARVEELLDPMVRSVRPGGRIFISVPNEERHGKRPFEPLDWPPHHVSRWRPGQLAALASRFGLELRAVSIEPPAYSEIVGLALRPAERALDRVVAPRFQHALLASWRRLLVGPRRYRWTVQHGAFRRCGVYGHAILAELRRPEP